MRPTISKIGKRIQQFKIQRVLWMSHFHTPQNPWEEGAIVSNAQGAVEVKDGPVTYVCCCIGEVHLQQPAQGRQSEYTRLDRISAAEYRLGSGGTRQQSHVNSLAPGSDLAGFMVSSYETKYSKTSVLSIRTKTNLLNLFSVNKLVTIFKAYFYHQQLLLRNID